MREGGRGASQLLGGLASPAISLALDRVRGRVKSTIDLKKEFDDNFRQECILISIDVLRF